MSDILYMLSADSFCLCVYTHTHTYKYTCVYVCIPLYLCNRLFLLFVTAFHCHDNVTLSILVNALLGHSFKFFRENTEEFNYWAIGEQFLLLCPPNNYLYVCFRKSPNLMAGISKILFLSTLKSSFLCCSHLNSVF